MKPWRFEVASVKLTVYRSFLAAIAIAGAQRVLGSLDLAPTISLMLAWIVVAFVSAIGHELGHVAALRAVGEPSSVRLHGAGGTTYGSGRELPLSQNLLVLFAGSGCGLALAGAAWAMQQAMSPGGLLGIALADLIWVNLWWSALNLLPMRPLDGGRALQAVVDRVAAWRGARIARIASLGTAAALLAAAPFAGEIWISALAIYAVFYNARPVPDDYERTAIDHHVEELARWIDEVDAAERSWQWAYWSIHYLTENTSDAPHSRGAQYHVYELLADGRVDHAALMLSMLARETAANAHLRALVDFGQGRPAEAVKTLRDAFERHPSDRTAAWYADGLLRVDRSEEAVSLVAGAAAKVFATATALTVAGHLHELQRFAEAAAVSTTAWEREPHPATAYNVASSLARAGLVADAIRWLERAVAAGFGDIRHIDRDRDLDALRSEPAFAALREQVAALQA